MRDDTSHIDWQGHSETFGRSLRKVLVSKTFVAFALGGGIGIFHPTHKTEVALIFMGGILCLLRWIEDRLKVSG